MEFIVEANNSPVRHATVFARVQERHKQWLKKEAQRLNLSESAYVDQLLAMAMDDANARNNKKLKRSS